jgi:PKD repeat protein
MAMIVVVAGSLSTIPVWASSASATTAHAARVSSPRAAKLHCHRAHKSCSHATSSVTGTDGGLTVTFSSSATGSAVTFDIAWSETEAYGAVGPEVLSFGNGAEQGFGTPEYCLVDPVAASGNRTITYTYDAAGTYTASVTVGANCTPDHVTLTLPISIR